MYQQVLFFKKRAEEELQRSGIDYTIVRPGTLLSFRLLACLAFTAFFEQHMSTHWLLFKMLHTHKCTSMQGDKLILQHFSTACTHRRLKVQFVVGEIFRVWNI